MSVHAVHKLAHFTLPHSKFLPLRSPTTFSSAFCADALKMYQPKYTWRFKHLSTYMCQYMRFRHLWHVPRLRIRTRYTARLFVSDVWLVFGRIFKLIYFDTILLWIKTIVNFKCFLKALPLIKFIFWSVICLDLCPEYLTRYYKSDKNSSRFGRKKAEHL